jgi:hypothetical protein
VHGDNYTQPAAARNTAMSDDSQIAIAPSFLALYVEEGKTRPTIAREELTQRYDLCEDMANLLMETARDLEFRLGITSGDVLERIARGLAEPESGVSEAEAWWVVQRLRELLGWDS